MTYNDLESRSRSIVYILYICFVVRSKHSILEHPGFNISRDIMEKPNSVNYLFVTFKVGQGQPKAFQQRSIVHATLMLYYV
jgi:hypothetical protein